MWAGDLDGPGGVLQAADAARRTPGPDPPRALDVPVDIGLRARTTGAGAFGRRGSWRSCGSG
jgi:hypothetical protein